MAQQEIREQYKNSQNLETRISIYQYAQNPESLTQWISKRMKSGTNLKILELGCGTGALWTELGDSFTNSEIILSDLSEGMIETTKKALRKEGYTYRIIDFHEIPLDDSTFDIIISNHNLYHAEDLDKVLSEIRRTLKPGGKLYSSTNSKEHLREIREFIQLEEDSIWPNSILTASFGTESGMDSLRQHFSNVHLDIYRNELRIYDFNVIRNYLLSVSDDKIQSLVKENEKVLTAKFRDIVQQNGFFKVGCRCGLFTCV